MARHAFHRRRRRRETHVEVAALGCEFAQRANSDFVSQTLSPLAAATDAGSMRVIASNDTGDVGCMRVASDDMADTACMRVAPDSAATPAAPAPSALRPTTRDTH